MEETAEALGISLSAAKGRLFHAKKALRRSVIKLVDPICRQVTCLAPGAPGGGGHPEHGFTIRAVKSG
jgi:hypothetical protein